MHIGKKGRTTLLSMIVLGLFIASNITPSIIADTKNDTGDSERATVTLINEGFESGIPSSWINTGWVLNWYGFPHNGSNWVSNSAGGSYMTTPTLTFGDNTELSFWYAAESSGYPQYLDVKVDNTVVWSDNGFTHTTYQKVTVDLSSYSGDHTISFVNTQSSIRVENIDDILVTTEVDLEPPQISNVDAQPDPQTSGDYVDITCDVTDNKAVDEVYVNLTYPDSTTHSYAMIPTFAGYSYNQIYTQLGEYDYYIWANDTSGNSATSATYHFEINDPPTADFSFIPTNPSTADTVHFTDLSSDSDGTIVSWNWDFDDGDSSSIRYPSHSFDDDGYYNVCLTVTDNDGATDTYCDMVHVLNIGPTADFSFIPTNPSTADTVHFTDLSSDSDGTIVSWNWDFDDGDSSSIRHPSHSFDDDGTYTVTLTVEDDDGATDIYTDTITVTNVGPTADFDYWPEEPTILNTIDFTDTSIDTDGAITSWNWDFDDGNTSNIRHPTHQYTNPGNYTVVLTVTDDDGAIDTYSDMITVTEPVEVVDVNQSIFDRGFPIRHAVDGDWAGAQSFIPTENSITRAELYLRKFGTPEFDLTVEIRENDPQGTLLETVVFTPSEVDSSWGWLEVDFDNITVTPGTDYFIVCPPAPSGVTTSFGYEWGYAFGNQYDDGSFWFTRDGGGLWRDLPTMYEFCFRMYGIN